MAHQHDQHINSKNILFIILLNIFITLGQLIGGLISGSLSLISDAIHNFTDVISLIISYFADKISKKKQTLSHTFGYKRAEIIAAFINGISLIIVSIYMAYHAIVRFYNPEVIDSNYVIWLSILAILGNGFSVLILQKSAKGNLNMRSAYLHLFSDLLVSVAVLIGGLIMKSYNITWIDQVLTLIISIYLFVLSLKIVIESVSILMLFTPKHISIPDLEKAITGIPKIKNIHHVHLWQLNDSDIYFEAHIEFSENISLSEFDEICKQLELLVEKEFSITHTMIQPEFLREDKKDLIIQD